MDLTNLEAWARAINEAEDPRTKRFARESVRVTKILDARLTRIEDRITGLPAVDVGTLNETVAVARALKGP